MSIKPKGISLEIGRDDKGWFSYFGKQKLLHIRPTRHVGNKPKTPYNHRDWINARYGGLKIDIGFGKWRRPIPQFWSMRFSPWFYGWWHGKHLTDSEKYMVKEPHTNPWNSGKEWFTALPLWFPSLPYFFFSLCYGAGKRQPGFYLGWKAYELNWVSQGLGIYDKDKVMKYAGIPDPKYKDTPWIWLHKYPYPDTVAWGSTKEAHNIYVALSASLRLSDMVDDEV